MTELRDIAMPPPDVRPAQVSASKLRSAGWALLIAIVWCVIVGFLGGFTTGFIFGFVRGFLKLQAGPSFEPLRFTCTLILVGTILLLVAVANARASGNVYERLGIRSISRPFLIATLVVLIVIYGVLVAATLLAFAPAWVAFWTPVSGLVLGLFFIVASLMSPIAEELFFRGWLWTTLREHWGAYTTALVTSGLWLIMHLENGAFVFLFPVAIVLSLARSFGDSVQASIIVHSLYNVAAAGTPIIYLLGKPD